jgi:hypothetical protein
MAQTCGGARRRLWLFALGVALAGALASCRSQQDAETNGAQGAVEDGAGANQADPVQQFTEFAASTRDVPDDAPLDPAVIAEGLRTLAGALGSAGVDRPGILDDLRASAVHVVLNPESPEVAATVRTALTNAAAEMPAASASGGTPVQQAAESIRSDTALTAQPAAVRTFFQAAADSLAGSRPRVP